MVESNATTDRRSSTPRDVVSTRRPPRRVDNTHPQGTVGSPISIFSFIIYSFVPLRQCITIELTIDACYFACFLRMPVNLEYVC